MTINNCFKLPNLILTAFLVTGLCLANHASAQETRSFLVDLNTRTLIPFDTLTLGSQSTAFDINDAGQVVGNSFIQGSSSHAFITGSGGVGIRDLSPSGQSYSEARGINESGQVAGTVAAGVPTRAFITGPDGVGIRDLGTLGGRQSLAEGINNSGQVVGTSDTAEGANHAFITGPDGMGMRDLGTLGGRISNANGINYTGQVVGFSDTAMGARHAFITGPGGTGMRDLGTLGGSFSEASGINDAGQIVGWSDTAGGSFHAFLTGLNGEGMTDLNSLVELPQGVILLTQALGINNNGQVIAAGLVPEPETYALMLAGLSLVGVIARRRKAEGSRDSRV